VIVGKVFELVASHSWCDPFFGVEDDDSVVGDVSIIVFSFDHCPSDTKGAYV
jgi:hypothetical protein